jgi:hypothetical protein
MHPGRDVHTIAVRVFAFDQRIAEIDADVKAHPPLSGDVLVALGDCLLNVAITFHCLDDAGELSHHAVAGAAEDVAPRRHDEPVEERPGVLRDAQRIFPVITHEPAIGGHIGAENRDEFALGYMLIRGTTSLDGGGNRSPL